MPRVRYVLFLREKGRPMAHADEHTPHESPIPPARYLPVALTVVTGLLLSLGGFALLRGWEQRQIAGHFARVSDSYASALVRQIQTNLLLLESPRSFFHGSEDVTRQEFRTFAGPFLARLDEAQAWEWVPRVADGLRAEHESSTRNEGPGCYEITELDGQGKVVRAAQREEYFPVRYIEPFAGNERALGFDVASEPVRAAALCRSRDTGKMVVTQGIPLLQASGQGTGLLFAVPVFEGSLVPPTIAERRRDLKGFVLGVFHAERVIENAFGSVEPEDISIRVLDVTDPQQPRFLCSFPPRQRETSDARRDVGERAQGLCRTVKLDVAGRRWALRCTAAPCYEAARRTWQPWGVLAAGFGLTSLVAGRFLTGIRRAVQIERLVAVRTSELRQSEREIRKILDNVQVGIAVIDARTHRVVDVNPVAADMIGDAKERIVGQACHAIICPAVPGPCPITLGRSMCNAECTLRTATGKSVPILKTAAPVTLSGKQCILESFIDISQRRRAEDALRASEEKFRTISDSALDAVIMIDSAGAVIHWNPAAERIFGFSRQEMLGRQIHALLAPGRYRAIATKNLARFVESGRGRAIGTTIELEALRKDGSEFPMEISLSAIATDGGWGAVAIVRDITGRKAAERELQRRAIALESANRALQDAILAAESANRAKSDFLTNMSHELRTPLHAILSFATFGIRTTHSAAPEELLEFFQLIHRSGNNLLYLVNDLLDLAKLESGKMDFNLAPADLDSVIRMAVDELRSLAAERGIRIEFVSIDGDSGIVADVSRLLQVLRNLLGNAIKFSEAGSSVEIELSERDARLAVRISDRGVGIPEEELEAIFDKFIQSSKTRTGAGGTGLGLAICRQIIDAHGGRIWAENREGGGAILVFEIPREPRPAAIVIESAIQPAPCILRAIP